MRNEVENKNVEKAVCDWTVQENVFELSISTTSVMAKKLSSAPTFKEGNARKLCHLLYPNLSNWSSSCRVAIRTGQKLNGHLQEVRKSFFQTFMKKLSTTRIYQDLSPSMFVHMYETTEIFETKKNELFTLKGKTELRSKVQTVALVE